MSAKQEKGFPPPFITGVIAGTALGLAAVKASEYLSKPRKRFKPPQKPSHNPNHQQKKAFLRPIMGPPRLAGENFFPNLYKFPQKFSTEHAYLEIKC